MGKKSRRREGPGLARARKAVLALVRAAEAVAALPADAAGRPFRVELRVTRATGRGTATIAYSTADWLTPLVYPGDDGRAEFEFADWEAVVARLFALAAGNGRRRPEEDAGNPYWWLLVTAHHIRTGAVRYPPDRVAGILEGAGNQMAAVWREAVRLAGVVGRQRRLLGRKAGRPR